MSENNNHIKTYATQDYVDNSKPKQIKKFVLDGTETYSVVPGENLWFAEGTTQVFENISIEETVGVSELHGEFTYNFNGVEQTNTFILSGGSNGVFCNYTVYFIRCQYLF